MKPALQAQAIKTKVYRSGEDLNAFLFRSLPKDLMKEGIVIAITSKIVSLAEGAVAPKKEKEGTLEGRAEKKALIRKEADQFLTETVHDVSLTIKHGILIPSAGIDESNSKEDEFILFPKNPYESAERIGRALRAHFKIKNLGIIITDSHTTPLRNGVTGIGLSHFGFKAVRNLIGSHDLFGRAIKMTQINVLDALSSAAVYEMGETDDCSPIAILTASNLEFTESSSINEIQIPIENDLYGAFLRPNS